MIRRIAATTALLLICYGGFLVAAAPAAWVAERAGTRLRAAGVALGDPAGSAWDGSAEIFVRGADLGRLDWRAAFWPLLFGRLSAQVRLSGTGLDLRGHIRAGHGIQLGAVHGTAGLRRLAALMRLPTGLDGTLRVDIDAADFAADGALRSATGRLAAADARLPALGVRLGNLILEVTSTGEGIRGVLRGSGGDLALAGTLTLAPSGAYTLQATLVPNSGQNRLADGLAAILGSPDGQGRYHYNASGVLRLGRD